MKTERDERRSETVTAWWNNRQCDVGNRFECFPEIDGKVTNIIDASTDVWERFFLIKKWKLQQKISFYKM